MLILQPGQPHGLVLAMSFLQLKQWYGCGVGDVEFTAKTVVRMWCLAMSSSQLSQWYGCSVGDVEFTARAVVRMWCGRC